MTTVSPETLDALRTAEACMQDVRALSGRYKALPVAQIERTLLQLVEDGEDRALSRLLQVCAYNRIKLDAEVLCRCIGVCETMVETGPCIALQDADVVAPLLAAAVDEALSLERQLFAARLAAELTVKFELDRQPVRKVLRKLDRDRLPPDQRMVLMEAYLVIDESGAAGRLGIRDWTELQLSDLLPERKPHAIIGGYYSVRRPVPKLGRNDPCRCGSGKKYKKCCYAKDQELLRDASQYAGATKTQLKASPGLVNDPEVIEQLRAYELKKLKPSALSEDQLYAAYHRALDFGLRELAFEMLLECQRRPGQDEFDPGHFEDLIDRVLEAGDLELAKKIREHWTEDDWYRPHAIRFRFDLLEHPERYAPLDQHCRKSVCQVEDEETEWDEPLIRLAHDFAPRYPALAVVFARAAIASNPERHIDNQMLLEMIWDARIDLDLEPGSDPAEDLFDWIEDRNRYREKTESENEEIQRLADRLDAARSALDGNIQALREMEQQVKTANEELEKARETRQHAPERRQVSETSDQNREAVLQQLRSKVDDLKSEIREQQTQRRQLRKQLAEEREKRARLSPPGSPGDQPANIPQTRSIEPAGKVMVPEYTDTFRRNCETLPGALAAKAVLATGRFASHDGAIWRHTKPLERLPEHYRIRIGEDYRIILRWQPGKLLRILDVIPRQDLESWIRRHG